MSDVKVTFLQLTAIQKIQEDTVNILSNGLQFIKQNIIRSKVNNNTFLMGILIHIIYVTHSFTYVLNIVHLELVDVVGCICV